MTGPPSSAAWRSTSARVHPTFVARTRLDRLDRPPMRPRHPLDIGGDEPYPVARRVETAHAGRRRRSRATQPPLTCAHRHLSRVREEGHQVGFVQRADPREKIAHVLAHAGRVAAEALHGIAVVPAPDAGQPTWGGEVVQGHERGDPVFQARPDHPLVVVQGGAGEVPRLRLDPGPLEREPIGAEAELGQRRDVLGIAVVMVICVAGGLVEDGVLRPFQRPQVGVHVAALHLVAGGGRAQRKPSGNRVTPRLLSRSRLHTIGPPWPPSPSICKPLQRP